MVDFGEKMTTVGSLVTTVPGWVTTVRIKESDVSI